jgi:amino acid adenylation domain-containing protein
MRGDRVALLLHKSPRALSAMFASLKADCIYVPLDPASPPALLGPILQLCECRCLIAEVATAGVLNELIEKQELPFCTRIAWLDEGAELSDGIKAYFTREEILSFPDKPVQSVATSSDAAHIMFTPGSTGAPKGVVITHSNVIHFIEWAVEWFGFTAADRISGFSPLHCDLSTFDIYGTIAAGAQVHLLPPDISVLPHRLASSIRKAELTQWFSGPFVLHQMAKLDIVQRNHFPKLRRLLWCGDKFPPASLIYWMRRLPHVSFVNLYGVTEATVASSYYRVLRCPEDEKSEIPIGAPRDGETLLVLDDRLRPTPQGEIGDLYIGGAGLSPGYWRDPEKTEEAFRSNPFISDPSNRIFRTGDRARIGDDGKIYLLGDADSWITSGGYGIELGEIEAAVQSIPQIQDAVAFAVDSALDSASADAKEISCAYVPLPGASISPPGIKLELARVLPQHMIPTHWIALDSLPRNCHGKVDRMLLKERLAPVQESEPMRNRSAGGL